MMRFFLLGTTLLLLGFGPNTPSPLLEWNSLKGPFPILNQGDPQLEIIRGKPIIAGEPFSGTLIKTSKTGQILWQGQYKKGQRNGPQIAWYPNGQVQSIRYFQDHRKHGQHLGWWPNGNAKFETHFYRGKTEGVSRQWYETGQLFLIKNYRTGKESGLQKAWGPKGQLYANYVVKGGRRYGLLGSKPCYTINN